MVPQHEALASQGSGNDAHLDFHQHVPSDAVAPHTSGVRASAPSASLSQMSTPLLTPSQPSQQSRSQSQFVGSQKRPAQGSGRDGDVPKRQKREVVDLTEDDDNIIIKVEPVDFKWNVEEEHDIEYWKSEAQAYEQECSDKTFQLIMIKRHWADALKENDRLRAEIKELKREAEGASPQ